MITSSRLLQSCRLQVVVTTTEMARGTVLELHRQGQQLELAGNNVSQVLCEIEAAAGHVTAAQREERPSSVLKSAHLLVLLYFVARRRVTLMNPGELLAQP